MSTTNGVSCKIRVAFLYVFAIAGLAPMNAAEHTELTYASVDGTELRLDLFRPTQAKVQSFPTVIWVHGGAWRAGSKSDVPVLAWLNHGFAIASVDYRLSPAAKFPAQVHDIKAAIRYLRASADQLNLDPNRFVIAGASAGGHLAALVGVSSGVSELEGTVGEYLEQPSDVQAIVAFYGASNLQTILSQSTAHGLSVREPALQLLLGGQPDEVPDLARLASPVAHVDSRDPPLWLIHGDADPQMPFEQSQELNSAFQKEKLSVNLDIVPGGKHGGSEFFSTQRLSKIAAELLVALSTSDEEVAATTAGVNDDR